MVSKPASTWEKSSPELVALFEALASGRASDQSEENVRLGRPIRRLDRQRQYSRKPARCQVITVAGFTIAKAPDHRGYTFRSMIQNSRSSRFNTGRRCFRFSTATCWRRASTSNEMSRRLRKKTAKAARIARIVSSTSHL